MTGECKYRQIPGINKKNPDEREERLRTVQIARAIIKEDIQSKVFENSAYPSTDDFFSNASIDIPETLRAFVDHAVVNKKDKIIQIPTGKALP